jgi:putative ABC transport system permease protein
MATGNSIAASGNSLRRILRQWQPDVRLGFDNLLQHKLRSLLTMLGMIFGVAAVVSMLSIGAGAQQKAMAFIEQLGVRNLIVEAKEASNFQSLQKVRRTSPGLTLEDYRVLRKDVAGVVASSARKRFTPSKMIPKPEGAPPDVYGVDPSYTQIEGLRLVTGRFFNAAENARAAPVCVLGAGAKADLFGASRAVGRYVKVDDQWFHVIGVAGPQLTAQSGVEGVPTMDLNNLIYAPVNSVLFRLQNSESELHDEIDGIYLRLASASESPRIAAVVRGVLNTSHHHAGDFSVIVPAELLAQQRRTERLFNTIMVAIASISLLRRAVGARQRDIVRQFVIEAVLISFAGGVLGIFFGFGMSRLIAWVAGWSTIVTISSILLAFLVSISVGVIFGAYPALKASRLDPVEAIRYE